MDAREEGQKSDKGYKVKDKRDRDIGDGDRVDIFVHGYNVGPKEARKAFDKFEKALQKQGYDGEIVGFSWHGDVGATNFKEAKREADKAATALKNFISDAREKNPDAEITLTGHSLGARVGLEALNQGAKVDAFMALQGAVDNESIQKGGMYGAGLNNAERALSTHSESDGILKGPYSLREFDNALGYTGPENISKVDHRDFKDVDASPRINSSNGHNLDPVIERHSDIYNDSVIRYMMQGGYIR